MTFSGCPECRRQPVQLTAEKGTFSQARFDRLFQRPLEDGRSIGPFKHDQVCQTGADVSDSTRSRSGGGDLSPWRNRKNMQ